MSQIEKIEKIDDIIIITNKIKELISSIDIKEKELFRLNNDNIKKNNTHKEYLQNIISEYHNICKKIYNK